ncbi:MAG: BCCT family transporter, partial [Pseudomonadota bacterium]|nr:BCCT family transporter [Pseudomonadota bacterium]
KTWQVLASLLVFPSIPLGIWFSVLYFYHLNGIETTLLINISMVAVGIIFVINSFDSLIRLYTDNLNLSAQRLGTIPYVLGNAVVLFGLTLAFQSQWLQIQWIGTAVIGIYVACLAYIILFKRSEVMSITASPEENVLDFNKIKTAH